MIYQKKNEFEKCINERFNEIEKDDDELTNEIVGDALIRLFGVENGGVIHVGDIGDSRIVDKGKLKATLVIEEDGEISWQLNPIEHSDKGIITLPVEPLEEMPDWWYASRAEDEYERANRRAMRQNVEEAEGGW